MASSGLLAPDGERIDRPAVSAEGPVTPEISVSDAAVVPIEATGWIDARAAEPAGAPATSANLSAPEGTLDVTTLPSAGGDTLGEVALAGRGGEIETEIRDVVPAIPLQLTLLPRQGTLTAAGTTGPSTAPISSAVPMAPAAEVTVTGSIGTGPGASPAELEAAEPVPPPPPAPSIEPEAPAFDAPLVEAAIEAPVPAEPAADHPVRSAISQCAGAAAAGRGRRFILPHPAIELIVLAQRRLLFYR